MGVIPLSVLQELIVRCKNWRITSGFVSAVVAVIMLTFFVIDRYWKVSSENPSVSLIRRANNSKSAIELYKNGDYDNAYKLAIIGDLSNNVLQWYLGWMYFEGRGTTANTNEAFRLWAESAHQGNPMAQNDLAIMYEFGEGVEANIDCAIHWYERAAKQNLTNVAIHLGHIYEDPKYGKFNVEKAIQWFEYAYRHGDPSGARHLGWMCERGRSVPMDMPQAIEWYRKAAALGDINSMCRLAIRDICDKGSDVSVSIKQLEYCATNGSVYARHLLVDLYEFGIAGRLESDANKAYVYACKFGDSGDMSFQTRAGDLCLGGQMDNVNPMEAVRRYNLAVRGGDVDAMYKLGKVYSTGNVVPLNHERAFDLYCRAVRINPDFEEAHESLGLAYRNGLGTSKSIQDAIRHFEVAVEYDNDVALLNLAEIYESGEGVAQDLKKALDYYIKLKRIVDEEGLCKADEGMARCLDGLKQQRYRRMTLLGLIVILVFAGVLYGTIKSQIGGRCVA